VAALAAIMRDERSSEAGLKFLVLSGISSAVLLYGMVFVYGYTGTTDVDGILREIGRIGAAEGQPFGSYAVLFGVVAMVAGFGFKMAVVPFHMWVPDVYEGAPTPVTAYLSVASKAAGFAVVMRVLYSAFGSAGLTQEWSGMLAVMAAASMLLGNLLALWQRNIKRMLAYSTVAHAGYILGGLAAVMANAGSGSPLAGPESVLFYLVAYAATNLAAFLAVIAITNRTGSDLIGSFAGMGRRAPVPALFLALGLVSLLGMPPTAGFMAKVFVFSAAVNSGLLWLAVVGAVNTAISAFYYLRVIRVMYLDEPEAEGRLSADPVLTAVTGVAVIGVGVFGFGPWLLMRLVEQAVRVLPSLAGA
ncbi:MAG: NADH-quinone oxidoreductase subunit N, partial [Gemmatimonadetes bacterium]|nr:NADH-quinone oxidoreductase subunit N [Gemmatimonadota bacterium]